jgi:hypothetical protein
LQLITADWQTIMPLFFLCLSLFMGFSKPFPHPPFFPLGFPGCRQPDESREQERPWHAACEMSAKKPGVPHEAPGLHCYESRILFFLLLR